MAILSLSAAALGGCDANHHLRQSLVLLDMLILEQPVAYVGGACSLLDAASEFASESTKEFLSSRSSTHSPTGTP